MSERFIIATKNNPVRYWSHNLEFIPQKNKAKKFKELEDAKREKKSASRLSKINLGNLEVLRIDPSKGSKYGSNTVWYDPVLRQTKTEKTKLTDIYFPSKLEYKVYSILTSHFPVEFIARQQRLGIKPATMKYEELFWKVDFAIRDPSIPVRYSVAFIEAKGMATDDFKRNLQYLEFFNKELYNKLIVVGTQKFVIDKNTVQISLASLEAWCRKKASEVSFN